MTSVGEPDSGPKYVGANTVGEFKMGIEAARNRMGKLLVQENEKNVTWGQPIKGGTLFKFNEIDKTPAGADLKAFEDGLKSDDTTLSKHDMKDLKKQLNEIEKKFQADVALVSKWVKKDYNKARKETLKDKATPSDIGVKETYDTLVDGGIKAYAFSALGLMGKKINALSTYTLARKTYKDNLVELKKAEAAARKEFGGKEVKTEKQYKRFSASLLSAKKRETMEKEFSYSKADGKEVKFKNIQLPLNKVFDEKHRVTSIFTEKFDDIGVASGDRKGVNAENLVNAYQASVTNEKGERLITATRHGVLSGITGLPKGIINRIRGKTEKARMEKRETAAKQFLQALVIQELSKQGINLEDVTPDGKPIAINLNSVSLLTPISYHPLKFDSSNEHTMLEDQMAAFEMLKTLKSIKVGGKDVPVNVNINGFNFAVDEYSGRYKLGTSEQYKYNLRAYQGLNDQLADLEERIDDKLLTTADKILDGLSREGFSNDEAPDLSESDQKLIKLRETIGSLKEDIDKLMENKDAYLTGASPYEVGAKIINLTNLMDKVQALLDPEKAKGFQSSFNCKSGKDRTGLMDGVAKTLAIMYELNGKFPSTRDLLENETIQQQYKEILLDQLHQGGGLKITQLNTNLAGYKNDLSRLGMDLSDKEQAALAGLSPIAKG